MIGFVLLFYLFIILRLGWIGPRIKGFRLGPEVVEQGLQGPNGASLGFKKKIHLLNRPSSGNGGGRAGRVQA